MMCPEQIHDYATMCTQVELDNLTAHYAPLLLEEEDKAELPVNATQMPNNVCANSFESDQGTRSNICEHCHLCANIKIEGHEYCEDSCRVCDSAWTPPVMDSCSEAVWTW